MKNKNPYEGPTWEEAQSELFSTEEIQASKRRVKFYNAIVGIRKTLGLTQREMSEIADIKQPMLARFESGENIPKISTASKILKPFGLSLAVVSDKTNKVVYKFDNKN